MTNIAVGCGQITWIKFTPEGAQWQVPEEQVLAEIAQAGYQGAPASPQEGRTAAELQALYAHYGLLPAPGYLGAGFWKPERQVDLLEEARRHATFAREVGCTELYVAPGGFDYVARSGKTRRELAGHVGLNDGLSDDEYQQFAHTLNHFAALTLQAGVRSCFHNHVGTVIETEEEITRLLALCDPAVVFLGPDTGHLAWAGADPVAFCRKHASRIKTIHLKDIDATVRERGRAAGWDYGTFSDNGIFVELGEGCVDLAAIITILREAGFAGWFIAETDVTQKPTALESATISRAYLRSLGI
ncbi:MAG: TIM barrel protein [Herpetosiphonaceae bacterium]|nr:TIM barrel protein [Herpetosiphonaceae bacterium]